MTSDSAQKSGPSPGGWARRLIAAVLVAIASVLPALSPRAFAQAATATKTGDFPAELVKWKERPSNPVFTAGGAGEWDQRIRERGWIMRDGGTYRMWYTGYGGAREQDKLLGYATSPDGIHWQRWPGNPLVRDHWVEDMMVVREGGAYYLFAEGEHDNHAAMLTSRDGIDWKWEGELDVRAADGKSPALRPCGTPTVLVEQGTWFLLYEVGDKGVWLAKTTDPRSRVWINVQDEAVLKLGPGRYDQDMIAVDQVFKRGGMYYAVYHGSGSGDALPRVWNTDIARSRDLIHWQKYRGNPIVVGDKSSGMIVPAANGYRLYTMHDQVDVFESVAE